MKASKGYRKPLGSEVRRAKESWTPADPVAEARQREERMLASLTGAKDDFEWIVANKGWLLLGHDTMADWWMARVTPLIEGLGLRPAPDLARRAIAIIAEEQRALPAPQRSSKRELAEIVGTSEWLARGREDRRQRRTAAVTDLENADGPVPADIPAALAEAIEETAASIGAGIPAPAAVALDVLCAGDPLHCGKCGADLPKSQQDGGHLRCRACDSSSLHKSLHGEDGDFNGVCERCTSIAARATETATGTVDATPVDAGGPQRSTSGPAAPTGSSSPEPVGVTPQDLDEEIGCPSCSFSVVVSTVDPDASLGEMFNHISASCAVGEGYERRQSARDLLGRVRTISPAADPIPEPPVEPSPTAEPQQPGQDSPTGRDRAAAGAFSDAPEVSAIATAGRSETDHHRAGVSGGEVRGDSGQSPAGPEELEDGVPPAVAPSTSDPDEEWIDPASQLMQDFRSFVRRLWDLDQEAVAAMLTDAEMGEIHRLTDQITASVEQLAEVQARTP